MKLPVILTVTEDWHARCGVTVFTQPAGTEITLIQWDADTKKYCVDFSNHLSDWFYYSVVERYCDFPLDMRRLRQDPLKPMNDDVFDCFLDHAMGDVSTRWAKATYLTSAQMPTRQEFRNLEYLLRGFFSAKK